jgi:hypothetical protein
MNDATSFVLSILIRSTIRLTNPNSWARRIWGIADAKINNETQKQNVKLTDRRKHLNEGLERLCLLP